MTNNNKPTVDLSDAIRNPARGKQKPQEPYEPIYRQLGLEPKALIDQDRKFISEKSIPPTQPMRAVDPFAIDPMQETYSSFDGKSVLDDGTTANDFDQQFIDNNEFVFPQDTKGFVADDQMEGTPDVGDYILMVFGKLVCYGNVGKIENRVEAILYGEDKEFVDLGPTRDDIVVLKRVDLKVGVSIKQ